MRPAARKRKTRQLEQVFKALQGDHTHPFAHEIYRRVQKALPRIGLATVYRSLHSLVEEGKIRTLILGAQVARYDPETSEHDHFVCERCGRVSDLFLRPARRKDLTPLAKDGYVVKTRRRDGPWDVSGLCRATPDLQAPRPTARTLGR